MTLPFRAIIAFHATARTGSMIQASQAVGVTPSAISQQIQILENHVGVKLFNREGRSIVLTEAGARYFDMIYDEVDKIELATEQLRGHNSISTLNVRISPSFATKCVIPRLNDFLESYPNIELRINATNELPDYSREKIDIEIRHGEGYWPGVYSEKLIVEKMLPLCSPKLAKKSSLSINDIKNYPLIYSIKNITQWNHWFEFTKTSIEKPFKRTLFDRAYMSIETAVNCGGIALESHVIAAKEIAEGTLVCPIRNSPEIHQSSLWIVCPKNHLERHKVQSFIVWVKQLIKDH
ncbi:LysR substrate-binding domain-containing protein [Halomonas dongshanensis]|uniref:LysR family transcriptional regulator n=1 Tax=Halomonas dongshanensis TaxID=2890835 RepID=A0ABT2EIG5_9GAMM|nr:LysR substrate-binding domain-containing protein [Halomonas dongshanensis]MCS2610387.1 LysR family transcriptional regulator [Halomonas dongshanensis]